MCAEFNVFGSFDVDAFTRSLQIVPSESWRAGELWPPLRVPRKEDAWCLSTRFADHTYTLENHLVPLLDRMESRLDALRQLHADLGVKIHLRPILYIYANVVPELVMTASTLGRIVAIGVDEWWLDSYAL